eukprot:TRINITY_DN687_c0_g1_i6.p1 TRINITY_DN687_c0_g1~~TRINITY_DN687_c0_g1_i6.p1  ORF type:complete len:1458 (+),score=297.65 TRINITY_DN687_c0_g1_i6:296-4669(+)
MKIVFLLLFFNFVHQITSQDGSCQFESYTIPNRTRFNLQSELFPELDTSKILPAADILVVVDESGSMVDEHAWLHKFAPLIDQRLKERGVGIPSKGSQNLFCLVRYGSPHNLRGQMVASGVDANEFTVALSEVRQNGRTEDGYSAMKVAVRDCAMRAGTAHIMILVTDEGRDRVDRTLNRGKMNRLLSQHGIVLNAVVNSKFGLRGRTSGPFAIGMTLHEAGYYGDNLGNCLEVPNSIFNIPGSGYNNTNTAYVRLAHLTDGAAWDLNQLRHGGAAAQSFTTCLIRVKIREIITILKSCRSCHCLDGELMCHEIELDEGQECGVWLPPQENCCGACSCETGTIICPYGRTNLCNSECRCELAPEEISHTLKCDAVVKDCPARSIDPPGCLIDYGPEIHLLENVTAVDHSVCGSHDTIKDTLHFPPGVTKTYCMLETLIHSINDNGKAAFVTRLKQDPGTRGDILSISNAAGNDTYLLLRLDAINNTLLFSYKTADSVRTLSFPHSRLFLSDGLWHSLVLVVDHSSVVVFLDCVLIGREPINPPIISNFTDFSDFGLSLGNSRHLQSALFHGCLEDPFILLDFGPEQISGLLSEVCGTPPVNPDDECPAGCTKECPRCEVPICYHKGKPYTSSMTWLGTDEDNKPDPCVQCSCILNTHTNLYEAQCVTTICEPLDTCYRSQNATIYKLRDQCCPTCIPRSTRKTPKYILTDWSEWTPCSVTCDTGTQARRKTCSHLVNGPIPPEASGVKYECDGLKYESRSCYTPCPIHGAWSEWSEWDTCSVSCGDGTHSRVRTCDNPAPQFGGDPCLEHGTERQDCRLRDCPIDGVWTTWTPYSPCSKTCSQGTRTRTRTCEGPFFGGADCVGPSADSSICNERACPIHGDWTSWSPWSTCSRPCGTGSATRRRTCTPPRFGGRECEGETQETKECNPHECPIHGGWTEWTDFSECSQTCAEGAQTRTRTCTNPVPRYGGDDCVGDGSDIGSCFLRNCPIDGGWSDWTGWGECDAECNGGVRTRSRECNSPTPQYGGRDCSGRGVRISECNLHDCPIHGGWSGWTQWTDCSLTCGSGRRQRGRVCDDPIPQHGGRDCPGNGDAIQECNPQECPDACRTNPCFGDVECTTDPDVKHVPICGPCPLGYQGDGFTCDDIDECSITSPCYGECFNYPGNFECAECPRGYTGTSLSGSGSEFAFRNKQVCDDIDECDNPTSCDPRKRCTNTAGSYSCGPCPDGYEDQSGNCVLVDLCETNRHGCNVHALCTSLGGAGYSCKCQLGYEGNGFVCNVDSDLDGIPDERLDYCYRVDKRCNADNCPLVPNSGQMDTDGDGEGDACDSDDDNDGILDRYDNCDLVGNSDQANSDNDFVGDACDNCPFESNDGQEDYDQDGVGDVCDPDLDGDGILNKTDNCKWVENRAQVDQDGDGVGDLCDNCPGQFNDGQVNKQTNKQINKQTNRQINTQTAN